MPPLSIDQQFFIYTSESLALAPGVASVDGIAIQADSNFSWNALAIQADEAAATQTESTRLIPNVTLQFTDTGSGRQYFLAAVPCVLLMGQMGLPFILPIRQLLSQSTVLQVNYLSFEAAITVNVRLALIGVKDFASGPKPRIG